MKKIPLKDGLFAMVDDQDFILVNSYKWNVEKHGTTYRAVRKNCFTINEEWKANNAKMHRFILKAKKGQIIDHIDGNGLNNQRSNLRICTHQQNVCNTASRKGSSSKYLGVSWDKNTSKWRVQIQRDGKNKHIGCFNEEKDAALIYNETAKFVHGKYARLNAL